MSDSTHTERGEVAAVLAAIARDHCDMTDRSAADGCQCGYPDPRTYEDHLAGLQAAALAPLIAAHEQAARVEASAHVAGIFRTIADEDLDPQLDRVTWRGAFLAAARIVEEDARKRGQRDGERLSGPGMGEA